MSVDEIYGMFPNLSDRRSDQPGHAALRAASSRCSRWRGSCAPGAQLLLLDEITEGLAPVIVQMLGRRDQATEGARLHNRAGGAELPLRRAACRPHYVMEHGKIAVSFPAAELQARMSMLHEYLGV
jgi:branched-chain amino acid transport system ATP-binding protein